MPRRSARSSRAPRDRDPRDRDPRGGPRRSTPAYPWRLLAWRARFALAAVLLGVATAQVVAELSPAPARTVPVVVAARDLAPGAALTPGDVQVVRLPGSLAPSGSHPTASDVVGRALVARATAGLPIVDGLLVGERLANLGPAGTVVAPVRLADPAVAALLRPGDRIDLLASAAGADGAPAARRLAERALVLADPAPAAGTRDDAADGLLGGAAPTTPGELTLVAVTPAEAAALAGSVGWASLSAVIVK